MSIQYFFTLLIATLLMGTLQAQTTGQQTAAMLAESPAGSKIIRFIKAVNEEESAGEDFSKRYFEPKLVEKQGVDKLLKIITKDLPQNDGILTVYKADRIETFKYELLASGSKGGWVKLGFTFEETEPYRIAGFTLDGIDPPTGKIEPMKL